MNCPFCDTKIIEKQKIYENKNVIALYNIRPANKGQCVVVPKRHITTIREFTDNELIDLMRVVKIISEKIYKKLNPIGFNYGFNESSYSGQSIEHFHFHIMPRIEGDKNKLPEYHLFHRDPKTKQNLSDKEISPLIKEFREVLNNS